MRGWLLQRYTAPAGKWRRRWCEVGPAALELYDDEGGKRRAALTFKPCTRIVPFKSKEVIGASAAYLAERPFGFVLALDPRPGERQQLVYFDALEEDELERWADSIAEAVSQVLEEPKEDLSEIDEDEMREDGYVLVNHAGCIKKLKVAAKRALSAQQPEAAELLELARSLDLACGRLSACEAGLAAIESGLAKQVKSVADVEENTEALRSTFRRLDHDGDGFVSDSSFKLMRSVLGMSAGNDVAKKSGSGASLSFGAFVDAMRGVPADPARAQGKLEAPAAAPATAPADGTPNGGDASPGASAAPPLSGPAITVQLSQ
eukprot:TRINITY_DN38482_c0_g1_i1.p1 TRINITY_DN38482_c0_g1~~TRINITY_DN38482_c0_g1_i1.p1  ORF type:complete len:319 (-),score=85.53 TRINITY_DN38482_c0_g1_i1:34-990(-)